MKIRKLILPVFSFFLLELSAQLVQIPNTELITEKNGYPFSTPGALTLDQRGFLWIGGSEGLARYDGYSFITLHQSQESKNSLPYYGIHSMTLDKVGNLWTSHGGGYVCRINPVTFEIWRTKIESADQTSGIKIFCDSRNHIWVAVWGMGLYKFDEVDSFQHICDLSELPVNASRPTITYNSITSFYEDKDYSFWMGSSNGLYRFFPEDSSIQRIAGYDQSGQELTINQLVPDNRKGLWVASWGLGLGYFNFENRKYESYIYEHGETTTHNIISSLFHKNENELLVGISGSGIRIFEIDKKRFSSFSDEEWLNTGFIGDIVESKSGITWIMSNKGLIKWNRSENYFNFFKLHVTYSDNKDYYEITRVLFDSIKRRTLIGTFYADGLHIIESNGEDKLIPTPRHPNAVPYNAINDLLIDKAGNTYVLTRDYLFQLTKDDQLKKIDAINSLLPASKVPYYIKMIQAKNGDLWVVSSRNGLFHFRSDKNVWEYIQTESQYPAVDNRVYQMVEDKYHRIWLMNNRIGITIYNPSDKNWIKFSHKENDLHSLPTNLLTDIEIIPNGDIYISSIEGISKFIYNSNSFENHNLSDGLFTNTIHALASDEEGILWASCPKGILRIDPNTWTKQIFSAKDGLSNNYFTFAIDSYGGKKMCIKTWQGFYVFDPHEIKGKKIEETKLTITSVRNLSSNMVDDNPQKIMIDYKENSLSIEFTALNFYAPSKNIYQYKMEGLDNDWLETSYNFVNYSGIPSGDYKFRVRLKGSKIESNAAVIGIQVSTPFWKTTGFVLVLSISGFATIYFLYRLRLGQVRRTEQVKREYNQKLAEVEMKALKAQMNPHFIFNSLNSINRYIIKSEPEKASMYLTKFSKLIRLILDNSNQKIVTLENEINALKLYIELEALRFNGKFTYTINVKDDFALMSVGIPPMIIQPFVENAIWHGLLHKEDLGKLEIQIERYGSGIRCSITDNGIGREKASELESKGVNKEKSYGMRITNDRLTMLNGESSAPAIEIIDLKDKTGKPCGTRVFIKIFSAELEPEF